MRADIHSSAEKCCMSVLGTVATAATAPDIAPRWLLALLVMSQSLDVVHQTFTAIDPRSLVAFFSAHVCIALHS